MKETISDSRILWSRQLGVLAMREFRRNLGGRRALPILLVASLPIGLALLRAYSLSRIETIEVARTVSEFAIIFQVVFLRLILFFTCAAIFVRTFRGELLEKSLHILLLAPIRRSVLTGGKFLGGLLTTLTVFLPTVVLSYVLYLFPHGFGTMTRYLVSGEGLRYLMAYLGVTTLACASYGALFMLMGLFFKNPMVPAIILLGWEGLVPFLPPFLKVFSLIYYLSSLAPIPVTQSTFSFLATPLSTGFAVAILLILTALLLGIAALKVTRIEISYGGE